MKPMKIATMLLHALFTSFRFALATTLWAMPGIAVGQIYVTNTTMNSSNYSLAGQDTINEYAVTTGVPVNAPLITLLSSAGGIALSGSALYVVSRNDITGNNGTGTIGVYDGVSGAAIKVPLISRLNQPVAIAVSGSNLFIIDNTYQIQEYSINGTLVNATLGKVQFPPAISAESDPSGSGSTLVFVTSANSGTNAPFTRSVAEFTDSPTGGVTSNLSLMSGLNYPEGIAVSGSALYVVNGGNSISATIDKYTFTGSGTGVVTLGSSTPGFINIGSGSPYFLAASGSNLFVVLAGTPPGNFGTGGVREYDAVSGAQVSTFAVSGLSSPGGIAVSVPCTDCGNTYNAPPIQPARSFSFVLQGDVRALVDTTATATDPTVNAFAYVNTNYFGGGGTSPVTASLDGSGDTVITFTGSHPILPSYTFKYGGGPSWPHFGFEGTQGTSLLNISQFWRYGDDRPRLLPNLSTACSAITGPDLRYAVFFTDISVSNTGNLKSESKVAGGQWTECAFTRGTTPEFLVTNTTDQIEKLSNVGFLLSDTAIPLDYLNFGRTPPPGRPHSLFTSLQQFNGLTLRPNGKFSFAVCQEPTSAPSAGGANAHGLQPKAAACKIKMP
jgi:hypothetical protein